MDKIKQVYLKDSRLIEQLVFNKYQSVKNGFEKNTDVSGI